VQCDKVALKRGTIGRFPKVTIYEFFGDQVHDVFHGDYPNLMKKFPA
jgi:hypothetical protein